MCVARLWQSSHDIIMALCACSSSKPVRTQSSSSQGRVSLGLVGRLAMLRPPRMRTQAGRCGSSRKRAKARGRSSTVAGAADDAEDTFFEFCGRCNASSKKAPWHRYDEEVGGSTRSPIGPKCSKCGTLHATFDMSWDEFCSRCEEDEDFARQVEEGEQVQFGARDRDWPGNSVSGVDYSGSFIDQRLLSLTEGDMKKYRIIGAKLKAYPSID